MGRVTLDSLYRSKWQELRTEVAAWDAVDEPIHGYDGYTRYWCKHAVLGVYWVAEQEGEGELEFMLTTDIDLTRFRDDFDFEVTEDIKLSLAEHVGWHDSAVTVVQTVTNRQLPLFEGG